jgi:5-methylthioadenosine/S-adenosylhomocysteine deaminase
VTPVTKRFAADHVVTMDAERRVHAPGVVDVGGADGDTIVWVGPAEEAPELAGATITRADVLMPGFVNAHAHTPMVLLRGAGEGLATGAWLTDVMWPREARMRADDVAAAMLLGSAELLTNGFTTTSEMYFFPDAMARSAKEAGIRAVIAAPLIEAPELDQRPIAEQIASIVEVRAAWRDDPLVDIVAGPHSAYVLSEAALAAVAELAAAEAVLVHIHVAEQRGEGDAVMAATGLTVPAYLDRLGLLGDRTLAAHGVWLSGADIELLAERGSAIVHCPASNGRHASGIAPVRALRDAGVTVGLGTDGPASHDRLDPFEEMRSALRYARLSALDAGALQAVDALAMATCGAADAVGRPDLGRLNPGARADLVALRLDEPTVADLADTAELYGRIVWAGSPAHVQGVWVGGTHVVDGGRCLTVDVAAAAADVVDRARALRTPAR